MKIRFHTIISIIVLLFVKIGQAQDFHLSHYDANPLYLNPALTGMRLNEDWKYRFNLNYREQKGNFLGRANKIIATGFDMPLNNKFSIGEFLINNKTINSSISTLNVMLSGSYKIIHKAANGHDRHNMSVGLQLGLLQKSFNPAGFVYDSQYSPSYAGGFDPTLPTGESYIKQSVSRFDMNMGVYYCYIDKNKKYSPYGGFSIYHLSQPNQSFTDINSQTPMRFTLHGGCLYRFNEAYSLLPQFMCMNQAHANELNIGIMGFDKIRCTDYEPMLGFSWRAQNAYIIHLGLKYKTYFFRVSYDVNTYYLKQYGNRGLEFSIVYTPKKKTPVVDLEAVLVLQTDSTTSIQLNIQDSLPNKKTIIITDTIHKTFLIIDSIRSAVRSVTDPATLLLPDPAIINDTVLIKKQKKIITIISYDTIHETIYLNKVSDSMKTVDGAVKDLAKIQKETEKLTVSQTPVLPQTVDSTSIRSEKQKLLLSSNPLPSESVLKKDTLASSPKKGINSNPSKSIDLNSKEKNDSVKTVIPKTRIVAFTEDSPFDLYQQANKGVIKDTLIEEKNDEKEPATTLVSETKFPIDSVFENVSYRVQLGAFKETVLTETVDRLLGVGAVKIKDIPEKGYTIFTIGDFPAHDDAIGLKNEMIAKGFTDAFIIKISPDKSNNPIRSLSPKQQRVNENIQPISPVTPVFPITPDSLFEIFHQDK